MALIKCHECGKEISTSAKSCPSCGFERKERTPFVRIVGGVLGGIAFIFWAASMNGNTKVDAQPRDVPEFTVSADEIAAAYFANTVAADQRFKGHQFAMTGTLTSINTSIGNSAYLVFDNGGNGWNRPQAELRKSEIPKSAELRKGDFLTVVCVGAGDIAKVPMLNDCWIQRPERSAKDDSQKNLANEQQKEVRAVSTSPIISDSLVQLAPEQAATECSIERDILQMAAKFRFENENRVSDQQVEKFISSHLGELVNSYQIGEWNRLITVPGGPTSIEANVKVAAFFGKSAPLSRLQELAAGTGPTEPAEHDKCLARYATAVPSSMPKVSWE